MNVFETNAANIEANSGYLAAYIRPDRQFLKMQWFTYDVDVLASTPGSSLSGQVQMLADSDFILQYMNLKDFQVDQFSSAAVLLQITDLTSRKTFFDKPASLPTVMGLNGFPYLMPIPRLLPPKATLRFDLTNGGVTTFDFHASLIGYRVFYGGPN